MNAFRSCVVSCLAVFWLFVAVGPAPAAGQVDADRLREVCSVFEKRVEQALADSDVPGMAAVAVAGQQAVWQAGFGVRDVESGQPMTPQTLIQVGSTTKSFTATLLGMLAQEGALDWDDPVLEHYPGFHMHDPWVTANMQVSDLMAQHSGLPAHAGDLMAFLGYGREDMLRAIRHFPPVYSFRAGFSYVNNLFLAAARVAENLTGQSWDRLMRSRILGPLGMKRSGLDAAGYVAEPDRATLYRKTPDGLQALGTEGLLFNWPYTYGPAGGLNADAVAMSRWVRLHLNRGELEGVRLFSEDTARELHRPRTLIHEGADGTRVFYCMGWVLVDGPEYDLYWHNGGTTGIKAWIGFSPQLGIGLVLLTNQGFTEFPDDMARLFFDLCSGAETKPHPDVDNVPTAEDEAEPEAAADGADDAGPDPALPRRGALPLSMYAGSYAHPAYGQALVREREGSLELTLGKNTGKRTVLLRHVTQNVFSGMLSDVDSHEPFNFEFMLDEDEVQRFVIREVDDGLALFARQAKQSE